MTGIYKIVNLVNGKVYVGSAVDFKKRWNIHKSSLFLNKHHSPKLQNSYNKHGVDNFIYEIIEKCDKEKLIEREQHYIDLYNAHHNGYNCRPKAENNFGLKYSEESKNKMKESRKKQIFSEETREKFSKRMKGHTINVGRKHSAESILKMKKAKIGKILSVEHKEKISKSLTGLKRSEDFCLKIKQRTVSDSTKEKMSVSQTGKTYSKETIVKMSKSKIGKKRSEETKNKIRTSMIERRNSAHLP